MTEHKDISEKDLIIISEAIMDGGLSQTSVFAINKHLESDHSDLSEGSVGQLVERARHQKAALTGKIDPRDFISQTPGDVSFEVDIASNVETGGNN